MSVQLSRHFKLRTLVVISHILSTVGLLFLGILPQIFENTYVCLVISTVFYAVGGGMIEVFVNPIIDSIPEEDSKTGLAFLHSFFCWGHAAVVVITTFILYIFGNGCWKVLVCIWSILPLANAFLFMKVPLCDYDENGHVKNDFSLKKFFSNKIFLTAAVLMLAGGAAEQAIAQWASLFSEIGLGVSKVIGDILGPASFAIFMGLSRLLFGVFGANLDLKKCLSFCSGTLIISYIVIVLFQNPVISLIGFMMCGFSVGLMWPGVLSLTRKSILFAGPAMFGLLSLFGDIGCSLGPWIAGVVSEKTKNADFSRIIFFENLSSDSICLKVGILSAIVFPIVLFVTINFFWNNLNKKKVRD